MGIEHAPTLCIPPAPENNLHRRLQLREEDEVVGPWFLPLACEVILLGALRIEESQVDSRSPQGWGLEDPRGGTFPPRVRGNRDVAGHVFADPDGGVRIELVCFIDIGCLFCAGEGKGWFAC